MAIVAFVIGFALPSALGWLALKHAEGATPVLGKTERMLWSLVAGPVLMMFATFLLQWAGLVRFSMVGFVMPAVILIAILILLAYKRGIVRNQTALQFFVSPKQTPLITAALLIIIAWSILKIGAGFYDTISVPTYWDDALDNWNMRGKLFYETKEITLEIPNLDQTVSNKSAESSYPPSVPLMKTWLATLNGSWNESLVNSIHAVWYLALLGAFYFFLRRHLSIQWSIAGTYLLASQPLLLVQGVNPYADILVSGLVFLSIGSIAHASIEEHAQRRKSWLLLAAIMIGSMAFVKNESVLLYVPVASLLLCLAIYHPSFSSRDALRVLCIAGTVIALLILPWLIFKWTNDLTFGNAKSISGLTIEFHKDSLRAMWFFLFKEANYLLLPVTFVLVVIAGRKYLFAFPYFILIAFLAVTFFEQLGIYTFTLLYTEAVRQTGIGRGISQLAPVATFLVILLGKELIMREQDG